MLERNEVMNMQVKNISRKFHGKFKISQEWIEKRNRTIQKCCDLVVDLIFKFEPENLHLIRKTNTLRRLMTDKSEKKYNNFYLNHFERYLAKNVQSDELYEEISLALDTLHVSLDIPCEY